MRRIWMPLAAVVAAGGLWLSADAAVFGEAEAYRARDGRGADYVVAESRWGHGSISGPVRYGRNGPEVRMPRGTWLECKRSCSETLRLATVDFWETQGRDAPDGGPNWFSLDIWY